MEYNGEMKNKLHGFQNMCRTKRQTLSETRKDVQLKFYKTIAVNNLHVRNWIITTKICSKLQTS
jgi:hypothetical protein